MKTMNDFLKECPELIFNNDGYEYLSKDITDKYAEQIKEIESILRQVIQGFIKFNNFKPCKDGSFKVRCQCVWTLSPYFIGVDYFSVEGIDEEIKELNK